MEISIVYGNSYSAYIQSTKTTETEAAEKTSKMSEAAKQELQHSRLMKEWYSGSRMTQASAVYEANITVESVGSSVFES